MFFNVIIARKVDGVALDQDQLDATRFERLVPCSCKASA